MSNVFATLGLSNDDATVEAWRSDLARVIREYFKRSQMSQVVFARQLGVKQSVVSRIVRGKLSGLSVEFLLRACVKLETRGIAHWGPSPDEAYVTTAVPTLGETPTSIVHVTVSATGEVFSGADLKSKAASTRKPVRAVH